VVITEWKHDYNRRRRHSTLGYQVPADYAATCTTDEHISHEVDQFSGVRPGDLLAAGDGSATLIG